MELVLDAHLTVNRCQLLCYERSSPHMSEFFQYAGNVPCRM